MALLYQKMQEKSKILILSTAYLPHIGGSELAIKNITDRINEAEFDLVTARLSKNDLPYEKMGNVSVFRVGGTLSLFSFILPKIFLPLNIFFKARKLINKNNYKFVHTYQASGAAGAAWLLKVFYPKLVFILTMQEGKNLGEQGALINYFRKLIIKKADRATAISNYLADYMRSIKNDLAVAIIPNGVDVAHFLKEYSYGDLTALENKLGIMPDDKVIISASRLVHKNGMDLLIEAMRILNEKYTMHNAKLLIVGEGPLRENLESRIKNLELGSKVIFTGTVEHKDLPMYLKVSDVFVRPSRSEGLGSAFLEAMAAGVPVIGTKVGGIPDFLTDRETGMFTKLEPEDIAFKINIILENTGLRSIIIHNAREIIKKEYDWDVIADKFRKIYV